MKYTLYTLVFLMAICVSTISAQTNLLLTIEHDGITRDYRLHLPPQYEPGMSLPLVFNLHGNGSNGIQQELYTGFLSVADAGGFILCHPDGLPIPGDTGNTWNVSFVGGANTDDVGFINALIDELHATYNVDLSRVYSCGMSNGGYMSYKLACELTDRFAAIASVTGSMVPVELAACSPTRTIPVMQIHGTTDPVVPYNGATWSTGVEAVVDWWVSHNGCTNGPLVTDIPDNDMNDGSTAELYEYTACDDETKVEFYKITNGGHTWPSGIIDIPGAGSTNKDFNASQIIWDFFNQYQLPSSVPVNETFVEDIQVNVFPNPAKKYVKIESIEAHLENVSLYNILGQVVYSKDVDDNKQTIEIPLSNLKKGTYIIKIKTDEGFTTQKVIKES